MTSLMSLQAKKVMLQHRLETEVCTAQGEILLEREIRQLDKEELVLKNSLKGANSLREKAELLQKMSRAVLPENRKLAISLAEEAMKLVEWADNTR